jgi:hypothetical protein
MSTPCCADALGPLLQMLLDAVTVALASCQRPACRYTLAASDAPAWDECCECGTGNGQVWVQLQSITPVGNTIDGAFQPDCGLMMSASVVVGVLRCAAVLDDSGNAPSAFTLTTEAREQMLDAAIVRQAIKCLFADLDESGTDVTYGLGVWAPLGPDGGCVGGSQALVIRFNDYDCSP